MSNMYIETKVEQTDRYFFQTNLDGTPKCPANWILTETSQLSNRYSSDIKTIVRVNESVRVPMKSNASTTPTKVTVSMSYTGTDSNEVIMKVNEEDEYSIMVGSGFFFSYTIDVLDEIKYLEFALADTTGDGYFKILTSVVVSKTTSLFDVPSEFIQYGINTGLVDSVTIGNKCSQRKTSKTIITYSSEIILNAVQDNELLDVLAFARLNKHLTNVYINNYDEAGKTVADYPQTEEYQNFFYMNHVSSEMSGIYKYITMTYQNDPLNGGN